MDTMNCFEQYQIPKWCMPKKVLGLYVKQNVSDFPEEFKVRNILSADSTEGILLFPYRVKSVTLWEREINCRLLHASVHADIQNYLWIGRTRLVHINQLDRKPNNLFDYHAKVVDCLNFVRCKFF